MGSAMQIIGAPLAAGLLYLDGRGGLHGWQWIFIGAPPCSGPLPGGAI